MQKLLSAGFARLLKHRVFWLALAVALVLSVGICFSNYLPNADFSLNELRLEHVFFTFYLLLGLFFAASISLILGSEYSDGALRNKLTVGHRRTSVYLSALLVCTVSAWAVLLVHLLVTATLGYFLFGGFGSILTVGQAVFGVVSAFVAAVAYASIFVAITLNCANKTVSAVMCILLALVTAYIANMIGVWLAEPELHVLGYGNGMQLKTEPNPFYIGGIRRKVLQFLYDLLPDGQINQLYALKLNVTKPWIAMSLGLGVAVSGLGCGLFCRKDIK